MEDAPGHPSWDEAAAAWRCPHCGQLIDIWPADVRQWVMCDRCGGAVLLPDGNSGPASDPAWPMIIDQPTEIEPQADRDELDGLRIRRISEAARSIDRARGYCLAGMLVCIGACVQMVVSAIGRIRAGGADWVLTFYVVGMALCGLLGGWLWRKSRALKAER